MAENFELRDFYNPESVTILGNSIKAVYGSFEVEKFLGKIIPAMPPLGLMERSNLICDAFEALLPSNFKEAVEILVESANKTLPLEGEKSVNNFLLLPHTQFVARNGLDDFETSMQALHAFTQKFTAEFAIRPFLIQHTEKTLKVLKEWTKEESEHVRRLVSEGTRPLLPWGTKLKMFEQEPEACFLLLEELKADPSPYVRKSVANHLNDHSKKHPEKVVVLLKRWNAENTSREMQWITRHALRTLVKNGHIEALSLLGFEPPENIELLSLDLETKEVSYGKPFSFSCSIKSNHTKPVNLLVDYSLYFKKANGSLAPKVFKWKQFTLPPGEVITIQKNHTIKPITTRKYYPGKQELAIQINGQEMLRKSFSLKMEG
jgi:3-methyladenine DNA glycosylase AlkC